MNHRLDFIRKGLRIMYYAIFFNMIGGSIYMTIKGKPLMPFSIVILSLSIFLSFIVRDVTGRGWVIFLFHASEVAVSFLLLRDSLSRIIMTAVIIWLYIDSYLYIRRGFKLLPYTEVPWLPMSVAFVLTGLSYYAGNKSAVSLVLVLSVALLITFLLIIYTDGIDKYLARTKNVEGLPVSSIIRTNTVFIIATVFIILTVIMVFLGLGAGTLVGVILKYLVMVTVLIVMLAFLMMLLPLLLFLMRTGGLGGFFAMMDGPLINEDTEPSLLARILEVILAVITVIVLSYLIYKASGFIIKMLMMKRIPDTDRVEKLSHAKSERVLDRRGADGHNSIRENRVRRKYRKTVLKYKKYYMPDEKATTGDIKKKIENEVSVSLGEITEQYENVRYGKTGRN